MNNELMKANGTQQLANVTEEVLAKLVLEQDLSKFSDVQKVQYVTALCERLGIDPLTKPFELMILNGKLLPYPTKAATNQLTKRYKLSLLITSAKQNGDMYVVLAEARTSTGQVVQDMGVVNIANLKGDALQNAMLKAVTKAKRRAVLSIVGLGMLDETEVPYNVTTEALPDVAIEVKVTDFDATEDKEAIIADWIAKIESCSTVDELTKLGNDGINKLDVAVKGELRVYYVEKHKQLKALEQ